MRLFLFLDDWLLDGRQDIVRRFPQPKLVGRFESAHGYASVAYDPSVGQYRCWYQRFTSPDELNAAFALAESDDGIEWRPSRHDGPGDPHHPDLVGSMARPPRPGGSQPTSVYSVYLDAAEPDPSRRYKAIDYYGWLVISADGVAWRVDPATQVFTFGSDCGNYLYRSELDGRLHLHHRPAPGDRRVALSVSTDSRAWEGRGVVYQTDALDMPLQQCYGMPAIWYEDYAIGLPSLFRVSSGESGHRHKMAGHDQAGLAYSYDGNHWLRPYREPLIGLTEPGEYGGGSNLPVALAAGTDDLIRLYTCGSKPPHDNGSLWLDYVARGEEFAALLVYTLRRDGFAYLEPMAHWGSLRTKPFVPRGGELTLNAQARHGQVLVQISDEAGLPRPGFTFDDCVPIDGDGTALTVRWRERRVEELTGKPCRVDVRLFAARLYALRWDCQLDYTRQPLEPT